MKMSFVDNFLIFLHYANALGDYCTRKMSESWEKIIRFKWIFERRRKASYVVRRKKKKPQFKYL